MSPTAMATGPALCLVIMGVRPDGTKELVAVTDGYRESTESCLSRPVIELDVQPSLRFDAKLGGRLDD